MAGDKKTTKLIVDLRAMDTTQLTDKIAELRKQLTEHHRANHAGELPSPAVIGKTRKAIAQAETLRSQKFREAPASEAKKTSTATGSTKETK